MGSSPPRGGRPGDRRRWRRERPLGTTCDGATTCSAARPQASTHRMAPATPRAAPGRATSRATLAPASAGGRG